MKKWLILLVIAVAFKLWVWSVIHSPRSLDEIYSLECSRNISSGLGFRSDITWHYIANDLGTKKDAFILWMPLNSVLLSVAGLFTKNYRVFQVVPALLSLGAFFFVFSAFRRIFPEHTEFVVIASSAVFFSSWFSPYLVTCDNFSLYLFLSSCFFYLVTGPDKTVSRGLKVGLVCALLHLTRSDGIYFIAMVILVEGLCAIKGKVSFRYPLFILMMYFFIMSPWIYRNLTVFGKVLPGDVKKMMMMKKYEEICNPGSDYSFSDLFTADMLRLRLAALRYSIVNLSIIMGNLVFSPFMLIGFIAFLKVDGLRYFYLYFCFLVLVNGILFPNAFMNGTLWHSSVALMAFFNLCTFKGLLDFTEAIKRRVFHSPPSDRRVFAALFLAIIFLASVCWTLEFSGRWNSYENEFSAIGKVLREDGCVSVISHYPGQLNLQVRNPSFILPLDSVESVVKVIEKNRITHTVIRKAEMERYRKMAPDSLKFLKEIAQTENFHVFRNISN